MPMPEDKEIPVRVAVRARPLIEGLDSFVEFVPDLPQVIVANQKGFTFDFAFSAEVTQEEVYHRCVYSLVEKLFQGYNATVLTYGQTGTGKTYTMGTDYRSLNLSHNSTGIIPRVVEDIFATANNSSLSVSIQVSFLEIYNEEVFDLLNFDKQKGHVTIREQENVVQVIGLEKKTLGSSQDALQCLEQGCIARTTAATAMNANSSRSHAVFTLYIQIVDDDLGITKFSKLHLVDLAGSETINKTKTVGDRFREGININLSLLALGNVIRALCSKNIHSHIPYRDSSLTRLLKDSIGENSHTMLIACISTAENDLVETLNTLRYADMARQIKSKPFVAKHHSRDYYSMKKQLVKLPPTPANLKSNLNITLATCSATPTPLKRVRINASTDNYLLTSTTQKQWAIPLPPKFSDDISYMKNEITEELPQDIAETFPQDITQDTDASFLRPCSPASKSITNISSPLTKKLFEKMEESLCEKFQVLENKLLVNLRNKGPKTPLSNNCQQLTPSQRDVLIGIAKLMKKPQLSSPLKDKTNTIHSSPILCSKQLPQNSPCVDSRMNDTSLNSENNDTIIELPKAPPTRRRSVRISLAMQVPPMKLEKKNSRRKSVRVSCAQNNNSMQQKHNKSILQLLNTGSMEKLKLLPTVGPKTAYILKKWVELRGPLKSFSDMHNVEGLSKHFLQRFAHANLITLDP